MSWSWKLGRVAGIPIYVHWTFVILLASIVLGYWVESRNVLTALEGGGFILSLFGCVVLHELGHALTARGSVCQRPISRFCRSAAWRGSMHSRTPSPGTADRAGWTRGQRRDRRLRCFVFRFGCPATWLILSIWSSVVLAQDSGGQRISGRVQPAARLSDGRAAGFFAHFWPCVFPILGRPGWRFAIGQLMAIGFGLLGLAGVRRLLLDRTFCLDRRRGRGQAGRGADRSEGCSRPHCHADRVSHTDTVR